jgi:DNA-binding LytR/AlgR family response regulator
MNQVAVQINSHRLVRAHRSFMVNIDHITGIEGNTIQVGDHEVPMSKEWKDDIVGRLKFVR